MRRFLAALFRDKHSCGRNGCTEDNLCEDCLEWWAIR
jgi:hypothetical protein